MSQERRDEAATFVHYCFVFGFNQSRGRRRTGKGITDSSSFFKFQLVVEFIIKGCSENCGKCEQMMKELCTNS